MRPRTLVAIAALAGAFYFLLPQIADVSRSWHALQHINWAWLLYRLATYWLPVLPGWLCWRSLQHREYV